MEMDELITKQLAGEASTEEVNQVQAWIALRPENERHYQKMKKVFDLGEKHYQQTSQPEINVDTEWNRFVNTISKKEIPVRSLVPRIQTSVWLRVAAAVLLLIASGAVINYFIVKNSEVEYQTSGNQLTVQLPDGSTVTLNKHSELAYSREFNEEGRSVTLHGEAFFEVTHNPQKPFKITINNNEVEVLGTSFNVQGYDDRETLEVVVETGVVKFSADKPEKGITLHAGEKGVFIKKNQQLVALPNDDINFLSWSTQKIVFEETDLHSVIETLNKTFQANIVVTTDIPASCAVTVTFDHQTLDAVLNVLKTTLHLTYKVNGNRIEITSLGC